jgi:methyltransferase
LRTPLVIAAIVFAPMFVEAVLSRRHERALRARGAIEPAGDVYAAMQLAYPGAFLLMLVEGIVRGAPAARWLQMGAVLFGAAKALKYWAIGTLGPRWSFRVLVVPGLPLVTTGPYRFLRHPNYIAVAGEIVAAALMFGAPASGALSLVGFGVLLRRRIAIEERTHAAG